MVQNGAKYNRSLKQWQLPPGSKPTARMGVQGGDGEPDIKPLGQKKAALMKDAERKAKSEGSPSVQKDIDTIEKGTPLLVASSSNESASGAKVNTEYRVRKPPESEMVRIRRDSKQDGYYVVERQSFKDGVQSGESSVIGIGKTPRAAIGSVTDSGFNSATKRSGLLSRVKNTQTIEKKKEDIQRRFRTQQVMRRQAKEQIALSSSRLKELKGQDTKTLSRSEKTKRTSEIKQLQTDITRYQSILRKPMDSDVRAVFNAERKAAPG